MELLLAGLNHKSGVAAAARDNLAAAGAAEFLRRLREAGWEEAVVLSTCNRLEIYAAAAGGEPKERLGALARLIEAAAGAPVGGHLYLRSGFDAARHLFAVSSGLDSLVTGENEILGQVKSAYETAFAARMTDKLTNIIFQRAIFVGRQARADTGISAGQLSVASVAAALAERIFGTLQDSSVLILGAGQMAEIAGRHLLSAKPSRLRIANRTFERGSELAAALSPAAEAVRWEDFPALLETTDIVLASTGAPEPVLTRAMVESAMPARMGRSLFLIDIAMPRDIEDAAGELDHVYLYTLADLQGIVDENMSRRKKEISAADRLVEAKAREFADWLAAVRAGEQASLRHHPGRSLRRGEVSPGGVGAARDGEPQEERS
ncbi:MAG: glutamyl-tRNA reductase [Elusimicrobia bacterium]|nr:glutamyl-tRNA reductase [Elusimicrobiota bacterium]